MDDIGREVRWNPNHWDPAMIDAIEMIERLRGAENPDACERCGARKLDDRDDALRAEAVAAERSRWTGRGWRPVSYRAQLQALAAGWTQDEHGHWHEPAATEAVTTSTQAGDTQEDTTT